MGRRCGRTTVLKSYTRRCGIDRPSRGQVWCGGEDLARLDDARLTEHRRRNVGFVFQFNFRDALDGGALLEAAGLPGVQRAEPVLTVVGTFAHGSRRHKGAVIGPRQDATLTVSRNADGSLAPVPEQGLLMARRLADKLGVGIGDRVWLTPSKGLQRPRPVLVAGLVDSLFGLAV